jgi:hypothetical protein
MKLGFVYEWKNITNGKRYIGSHYGSKTDGYISSSNYFNEEYKINPENFERTILFDGLTREQALIKEMVLLKKNKAAKSADFYNLHDCPGRGWSHHDDLELSKIYYDRISKAKKGKASWSKGKSIWNEKNRHKLKIDTWLIKWPNGDQETIENMHEFCRMNNLNPSAMSRVARGKSKHHLGFWCKKMTNNRNVDYVYSKWESKGHQTKANFGDKNGQSKSIEIDGVFYSCMREASEKTGLSMYKLRKLRN